MEERQDQLTGRVRRNVRNQAINIPVTLGGVYSGHQQGVSPALDKRWQDLQKAIPTMTHEECNGYLTGPIAKFIPEIVKEALIARANEVSPSPVASGSNNNPSTGFNFPMSANSRQIASSCGICFEGPNAQGVALKGLACCKTNLICKSCLDQCTRGKTNPKCPFCRTANPKQLP